MHKNSYSSLNSVNSTVATILNFSTYEPVFRSTRESNTSEQMLANPMQYRYSFTGGYRSTLALFLGTLYMLPASWRSNNVARRIPCNSSSKSRDRRTKVTSHKAEIGTKYSLLNLALPTEPLASVQMVCTQRETSNVEMTAPYA